jgi:hypothetical protein
MIDVYMYLFTKLSIMNGPIVVKIDVFDKLQLTTPKNTLFDLGNIV